jgi:hypothetical protein
MYDGRDSWIGKFYGYFKLEWKSSSKYYQLGKWWSLVKLVLKSRWNNSPRSWAQKLIKVLLKSVKFLLHKCLKILIKPQRILKQSKYQIKVT